MEEGEASSPAPQLRASFTALSEYSACPLRYRYLHVEHRDEPAVEPDWRAAPREPALGVASTFDRNFGRAVHAALKTWQGDVDSGLAPVTADLEARISDVAQREGLDHAQLQRALVALHKGLDAYVRGPWPRCRTIALEHSAQHRLSERGFTLELALRVDRIAETDGRVAIIDFKTVPPHAMQLRADIWQLRTYALAAPELLGVATRRLRLLLIDLRQDRVREVGHSAEDLRLAAQQLLACARAIAGGDFDVAAGHDDRPCWCCGFRLSCSASLAARPPARSRRRGRRLRDTAPQ